MALFLFGAGAAAQPAVSVGVKGGVPLTEVTPGSWNDESKWFIVGPSVEFRLPGNFAVELSGLYQRVGTSVRFGQGNSEFRNRVRGDAWQFPVLGKYYFNLRSRTWQPYVASGFSFRTTNIEYAGTGSNGAFSNSEWTPMDVGAVIGGGVRFRYGRISVSPEFRYERWGSGTGTLGRKNQGSFLVGISF